MLSCLWIHDPACRKCVTVGGAGARRVVRDGGDVSGWVSCRHGMFNLVCICLYLYWCSKTNFTFLNFTKSPWLYAQWAMSTHSLFMAMNRAQLPLQYVADLYISTPSSCADQHPGLLHLQSRCIDTAWYYSLQLYGLFCSIWSWHSHVEQMAVIFNHSM